MSRFFYGLTIYGEAMKKQDQRQHYLASSLFLIGLVFLIESVGLAVVLSQAPKPLLGTAASVAWVYAVIKFFTGLITIFTGLALGQKK